jgi:cytochrome c-type biogenesis protein CcmH
LPGFLLAVSLLGAGEARAVTPGEMLTDPALEARARELSAELRCMVCQNQSIDDSDAPLAHDLRVLLRERIAAGDTNQQVIDFLVARYGEFILLKPPVNSHTIVLWATPFAVLVIGAAVIVLVLRRRPHVLPDPELTGEERGRLAAILRPEESPSTPHD